MSLKYVMLVAATGLALAASAAPSGAAPAATRSTLTFNEPFAADAYAASVNNAGQVVGSGQLFFLGSPASQALSWTGTALTDITPAGLSGCLATTIADDGTITGYCLSGSSARYFVRQKGVTTALPAGQTVNGVSSNGHVLVSYPDGGGTSLGIWSTKTITRISPPQPASGGLQWGGASINAAGVAVGSLPGPPAADGLTSYTAYVFASGHATQLPVPAYGYTELAKQINDQGYIIGSSDSQGVLWHGSVSASGVWTGTTTALQNLPGDGGTPVDLNSSGTVVGYATGYNGTPYPLRWSATGAVTQLQSDPGSAVAVNDSGVVVGNTGIVWNAGQTGPTVWDGATTLHLLAGTSDNAGRIADIDNAGKIVGYAGNQTPPTQTWHAAAWQLSS